MILGWPHCTKIIFKTIYIKQMVRRKILNFFDNDQAFPKVFIYKLNRLASYVSSKVSGYIWTEYDEDENPINSFAEGESNVKGDSTIQPLALGLRSHAEGSQTFALGNYSHSQGKKTKSQGNGSFSGGYNVDPGTNYILANGDGSFAHGYLNSDSGQIEVNGNGSFALGYSSAGQGILVNGDGSGSLGVNNRVHGFNNIAIGKDLIITGSTTQCLAVGAYNTSATTSNDLFIVGNGTLANRSDAFKILKNGNVYCYNDLRVTGDTYTTGAFYVDSDINKKNIIKQELDLNKCYDLIDKCSSIIYTLKGDKQNKEQIGLIAQEVQEFFPEIVSVNNDGFLTLDYSRLTVVILRILKDLIDRINKLENGKG